MIRWSLVIISRTINHDWSYLTSSPIVSNHTLTRTTNRDERLQMEIVGSINDWSYNQSVGAACDWSNYWSCDCLTHNHARLVVRSHAIGVQSCETCLRLVIADRSQNMIVDLVATDFARTITHDHYDQWHVLSTIWQRFQNVSIVTRSQVWRWLWQS